MVIQQMGLDVVQRLALEVNQGAALLATAVEAERGALLLPVDIFKMCAAALREIIFVHQAAVHHLLQLAVDGGHADFFALIAEVGDNVGGGNVAAAGGAEVGEKLLALLGLIL